MKKITNKYVYLLTAVISLNISIFINANDSAPIIQPGAPGKSSKVLDASDATNIASSIVSDGDNYDINGTKWGTSNAINPRAKICIFMGS